MLAETLAANAHLWGRYPPIGGTPGFRDAVASWLARRYGLADGAIDPATQILPVAGTREALFLAASLALPDHFFHCFWPPFPSQTLITHLLLILPVDISH